MTSQNSPQIRNWDTLPHDERQTLLGYLPSDQLESMFGKSKDIFDELKNFHKSVPQVTKKELTDHSPPKTLIVNARRDLSFFEANYELIDNSIDEWRRGGRQSDLHLDIEYNIAIGAGSYQDNAGGMDRADVYKVFIPGESTNTDLSKPMIGSFGMGAKKAIFRLTDGAKVVTSRDGTATFTSEVPERWEDQSGWQTSDGVSDDLIPAGVTRFYFLRLVLPPTLDDISDLRGRIGEIYAPLLRSGESGKNIVLKVNSVPVGPSAPIAFSGADGAQPKEYKFSETFSNLANSGFDVKLDFCLTLGLAKGIPGAATEPDFGIDVYANGRLIQKYLKDEFGFGTSGLGKNTQGTKLVRGVLSISGHSLGIPWDTHKREYFADHKVSRWLRNVVRPYIVPWATVGNSFANETNLRGTELPKAFTGTPTQHVIDTTDPLPAIAKPSFPFARTKAASKTKSTTATAAGAVTASPASPFPQTAMPVIASPANSQDNAARSPAPLSEINQDTPLVSEIPNVDELELSIPLYVAPAEIEELSSRFGTDNEDQLAEAIHTCLISGVVFSYEANELSDAFKVFEVESASLLSDAVKDLLDTFIQKKLQSKA